MKTYDPEDMSISFGGIPLREGIAEGTFLKIETPDKIFTIKQGADGAATRTKTGKRTKRVMLTLMQTSSVNDKLSALHLLDRNAPNGQGIAPLLIKDKNGLTLLAGQAFIEEFPDAEFGEEDSPREWSFVVPNPATFIGGAT